MLGVMQDYRVHKDEIHSKLVDIMKDRLLTVHLPTLLQVVETWNRPDDGDNQATPFAKGLTKVWNSGSFGVDASGYRQYSGPF